MQRRPANPLKQVGVLLNALVILSLVLGPVSAAAAPGPRNTAQMSPPLARALPSSLTPGCSSSPRTS